jgi:hypothetical protein
MKKYATFIALICLHPVLFGQPIVSEFWVPQIGDKWDQSATHAIPDYGPGGADATWDFSEVDSSGFIGSFTFQWIDTTGTPYIDSFPDANICAKLGVGSFSTYGYYREDNQGFHYLGSGSQFETQILYEPQTFDYIGLMYTETAIDSYKVVSYTTFSDPDSVLGFSSFEYDGYGTLQLPEASIDNAIRIHEFDIRYDSTDNFGSANVTLDTLETYAWIAEGSIFPVAQWQRSITYNRQYILGNLFSENVDGPDTIFAYNPNYTGPTAVKSVADRPELKAYPTIANQMITLDGLPPDHSAFHIYSMNGRLVQQGKLDGNVVHVADIAPGPYILSVGQFKPFLFLKQ